MLLQRALISVSIDRCLDINVATKSTDICEYCHEFGYRMLLQKH